MLIPRPVPHRTIALIGECKDRGPNSDGGQRKDSINEEDVENLRRVADALPTKRFKTYVILAKLAPFTSEEIKLAKTLNDKYRNRAILLTDRELEPYHLFERTREQFPVIDRYDHTPKGLANVTAQIYFQESVEPGAVASSGSPQG